MDYNDLHYFALIVEHGGFTACERITRISKSKLSRRILDLEDHIGVRLLQRSTRKLSLTEAGKVFYEHCAAMTMQAEAAREALDELRSEPSGTIRMTCPASMAQFYVTRIVADYMNEYPKVRIELDATDRVVDLVEEGVDLALRARTGGAAEPGLVARRLGSARLILVASPSYLAGRAPIEHPEHVNEHATIGSLRAGEEQLWELIGTDGRRHEVKVHPRLRVSDFVMQHQAALSGVGIALLPQRIAWPGLQQGTLVRVAKEWSTPETEIFVLYPNRRGMLPSVRSMIDYLVQRIPTALAE